MSDVKTLGQLADESGISLARVSKLLANVTPEQQIGRVKGFHPDSLKAALINKLGDELEYLGVLGDASENLAGYGA